MTSTATTFTEELIRLLDSEPRTFIDAAHETDRLPGMFRARDYAEAELEQLNSGMLRLLLEALRNEPPTFRTIFLEVAIPSFIREGEGPASLIRWTSSYLFLLGSALSVGIEPQHRHAFTLWFAGFTGSYLADLLRAAIEASGAAQSGDG